MSDENKKKTNTEKVFDKFPIDLNLNKEEVTENHYHTHDNRTYKTVPTNGHDTAQTIINNVGNIGFMSIMCFTVYKMIKMMVKS